MLQVHANTYRRIIKKAGIGNGFGWRNKTDRYRSYSADFQFVSTVVDYRNRRNLLKDGYVQFIGDRERKREAEALLRLWLLENGYTYELVMITRNCDYYVNGVRATEQRVNGIRITSIPSTASQVA